MPYVDFDNSAKHFGRLSTSELHLVTTDNAVRVSDCTLRLDPSNYPVNACRSSYTPLDSVVYSSGTTMTPWNYDIDYDTSSLFDFILSGFATISGPVSPWPAAANRYFGAATAAIPPPTLYWTFNGANTATDCRIIEISDVQEVDSSPAAYVTNIDGTEPNVLGWQATEERSNLRSIHRVDYGTLGSSSSDRAMSARISFLTGIDYATVYNSSGQQSWSTNQFNVSASYDYLGPDITQASLAGTADFTTAMSLTTTTLTYTHNSQKTSGAGWTFESSGTITQTASPPSSIDSSRR